MLASTYLEVILVIGFFILSGLAFYFWNSLQRKKAIKMVLKNVKQLKYPLPKAEPTSKTSSAEDSELQKTFMCKWCHKEFRDISGKICPHCKHSQDEKNIPEIHGGDSIEDIYGKEKDNH